MENVKTNETSEAANVSDSSVCRYGYYIATWVFPSKYSTCGESRCCCKMKNKIAFCKNKNLTFIPVLPKGIKSLDFVGNNLKTVSAGTFDNVSVSKLEYLGLRSNGTENIHNDTFKRFDKLRALSLQNNKNLNWTQVKATLHKTPLTLNQIFLDNTGLTSIPSDIFDGIRNRKIKMFTLRNNSIKVLNEEAFYYMTIKTLDLSHNWIREISLSGNGTRLGQKTIESLSLSYNEFVYWPPWFCDHNSSQQSLYPNLKSLNLRGNSIMVMVRKAWLCLKSLSKLNLGENVIQTFRNDSFVDLMSLNTLHVSYMAKPVQQIEARAFHNGNLKTLHFDNNNIDFGPDSNIPYSTLFTFCPNLTRLLIGYNNLRSIYENELITMLSPLKQLSELHLEGSHLFAIPENLFGNFPNLTKLYLGKNKIKEINPKSLENVTKLDILYLDANKVKVVNDTFPAKLQKTLKQINLAGNPFSCSFCEVNNNTWLRNWINDSKIHFIGWPSYYKCASLPSEHGSYLKSHKPKPEDCETANPMIIAYATIGAFLFVFSVLAVVCYRGRWYIRYWTIKYPRKLTQRVTKDPERQRLLGHGFTHDAYVIYHDNDRGFVRGEILEFMENKNNYKLFIWDRDFEAGDQSVGIVVDNISNSNHVIVVISRSFLNDQWCDFQLAVSLDRQIELKRNFITLILREDIDKKMLSKTWCVLLTKTPTAEWCERKNDIRRKLFEQQILTNVPCNQPNRTLQIQVAHGFDANDE